VSTSEECDNKAVGQNFKKFDPIKLSTIITRFRSYGADWRTKLLPEGTIGARRCPQTPDRRWKTLIISSSAWASILPASAFSTLFPLTRFECASLNVFVYECGRITRSELFELDALDAALVTTSRFHPAGRPRNLPLALELPACLVCASARK
jgi:hypothetical protein